VTEDAEKGVNAETQRHRDTQRVSQPRRTRPTATGSSRVRRGCDILWASASLRLFVPAFLCALCLLSALPFVESQTLGIYGFAASSVTAQRSLESRFQQSVEADSIRDFHKEYAAKPHVAGSPRDRELAEWTRDRWREYGLEEVDITEHEVLLPYPDEVIVEMTAPRPWRASMKEDAIPGDEYTNADVGIPYHAYSASGDVTAPVVYAGSGNPADYDWLRSKGVDIKGKIALVRYSVPYSYRGFKALTAQERGAAGILIYSDPADDGFKKGKVYPDGPWGPDSHIQRGGIVFDFMVPGDPLTPGWASLPGAKRIAASESAALPKIMSAPLSWKDAQVILRALGGPEAPKAWQGAGLPQPYRVGAGPATVRLRLKMDDRVRPIWTVTGKISGREEPEALVIAGNHRDAWIYGGVDPSSGSAALMELARALGALAKAGVRPRRTILLASWDAEEFTLTSSTEWGEQHERGLRDHAVAYLNVDSAASGPNFGAAAVPALNRLIAEVAAEVRDPVARIPIVSAWRARAQKERGTLPTGGGGELVNNKLGSGSDYTVFLNFLGIPVADLSFDGDYGVYHSAYDNHHWVARIGDPGFRYHAAMVRVWGLLALRLANADVLPLDYTAYAGRIRTFIGEIDRRYATELAPARAAADRLVTAAAGTARDMEAALADGTSGAVNRRLIAAERAFLDPEGIPGRPWYRHQIYAPKFTYAPELLPAVAEAVQNGNAADVARQAKRLAAALDRAAAALTRR
jgi:N-acetylated-alpha-linked acidic dipeptidase